MLIFMVSKNKGMTRRQAHEAILQGKSVLHSSFQVGKFCRRFTDELTFVEAFDELTIDVSFLSHFAAPQYASGWRLTTDQDLIDRQKAMEAYERGE
jgi:hypothetical protein